MPTPRTIKTASRILHAGEAVAANPWFDDAPDDPPSPPRVAFVNPRSGDYLGPVRALAELHDALIWALVGSASPQLALSIYARVVPTLHTLPSLLESLALSAVVPGAHHFALTVHAHCVKLGLAGFLLVNNALILAHACLLGCLSDALLLLRIASSVDASTFNTLIMAHARAGPVADARALFDEMPTRNVVSWSAMVNGKRTLGMISLMPLYVDQSLYKMPVMR